MKSHLGKKLYSLKESFMHLLKAFVSVNYLRKAKKKKIIDEELQERIMLSVTSVNGCAMCSYAHTKMALDAGLNDQEIRDLLDNKDKENIPDDQLSAIMFATYYADCRSRIDINIWDKIVEEYGYDKALGILGAIRIISVGNIYGIAFGSFISRFKKDKSKRDERTTLFYELMILITLIPFTLIALLLSYVLRLFKIKLI